VRVSAGLSALPVCLLCRSASATSLFSPFFLPPSLQPPPADHGFRHCIVQDLGLMDDTPCEAELKGKTFVQLTGGKTAAAAKVGLKEDDAVIERMEWLGLFSDKYDTRFM
jgi:hypothetical protein